MEEQFKCQFDDGGIRDVHKAMENLKLEDPNLQLADLVASVRSAMEQTREQSVVYQQMAEASKSLKQFCEMKDEIISQFRSITAPFADLVPPTPFKIPELDRSAFIEPVLAARETIRVCGLMKRSLFRKSPSSFTHKSPLPECGGSSLCMRMRMTKRCAGLWQGVARYAVR